MSTNNQDPSVRARERARQLSGEQAQEIGALTLRHQQAGHAEATRRAQNLLNLNAAVGAARARLAEVDYEGVEMVNLTTSRSIRSREEALQLGDEQPGWHILDYSHTTGAVTERREYYLLANGSYVKVSSRSVGGKPADRIVHVVSAGNVATLTQPQFDVLLGNVNALGVSQQPTEPGAE